MSLALSLTNQNPQTVGIITFQDLLKDKNGTRLSSLELNDGEYEDFLFELVYGLARLRGSISGSEPNLDTNLRDPVEIIEELDLIGSFNDTTDLVALLAWENLLGPFENTNIFSKANLAELIEDLPINLADYQIILSKASKK